MKEKEIIIYIISILHEFLTKITIGVFSYKYNRCLCVKFYRPRDLKNSAIAIRATISRSSRERKRFGEIRESR